MNPRTVLLAVFGGSLSLVSLIPAHVTAFDRYSYDLHSYAIVKGDATLKIKGQFVRLFGAHIPNTTVSANAIQQQGCETQRIESGADALEDWIHGFVYCDIKWKNPDGTVTATCWDDFKNQDLSAYLIRNGWAMASPEAPREYHMLERFARREGRGLWSGCF